MNDKKLQINNLSIGYAQKPLVSNIETSLSEGKFCVLFGANGAGKSTLIKSLRGVLKPINGEVFLANNKVDIYSQLELARKIAVVTTDKKIAPGLRVWDVISFGRIPYQGAFSSFSKVDKEIIEKYISRLNIKDLVGNLFEELSDGQKQRVMFCRALVQDTDLILLDEPTAHLDVENRIKTFQLLREITNEEKKIVICSTHEIETGLSFADDVWIINKQQEFITQPSADTTKEIVYNQLFDMEENGNDF